ncbi:uncharacterized protein BDW47DRAFT_111442 [Aspergillus candidus]|uniref:Membrane anchor Opy2 N-terminal domain-containing protein n=1 Tax=Aspergillus candidus TaxID=41067 RepID=A0A2I2F2B7_ASPCN|nr:hypothetical protein BDW47DRAFT_111442 [Aspergillus candidus]PLB34785.1 hypothetical protein BDW47DRAFT_111442 [Aspergillus candidus]
MALYQTDPSFSSHLLSTRSIFKRCVKCESASPPCPKCEEGTTCTMISQSCDSCPTTKCIPTSSGGGSDSGGSSGDDGGGGGGSNAGAIAGGVVGGLACVAIVTFLVWWFVIRKKRQAYAQPGASGEKRNAQARKSTQSIASTVLTRASNVIQIAYIPGVTNRSPPETPGSLVPPVPPLPGSSPDQHFFMPGDLRDSSWTDASSQHRSIAPSLRSSVATTIYRDNAIVSPMPAQQAMRSRAAVVSIHGGNGAPMPPDAPAVPAITPAQLARAGVPESTSNSSIVARTVTAKPVMVKAKKHNKGGSDAPSPDATVASKTSDVPTSGFDASSDEEDEDDARTIRNQPPAAAPRDAQSRTSTVIEDSPAAHQGPFQDQAHPAPPSRDDTHVRTSAFLETDEPRSNRSSRVPPPRVESPFSDLNEVK